MRFIKISLVIIIILLGAILTMAIKHADVKSTGDRGLASDWNKDHVIDSDVDFDTHKAINVVDPTANQDGATKKYVDDVVAIRKGIRYWTCTGPKFAAGNPDTDAMFYDTDEGRYISEANGQEAICSVELPHGAVVTSVIVYGDFTNQWYLSKWKRATDEYFVMANAAANAPDNTIDEATIDGSNDYLFLVCYGVDNGKTIKGAKITYTL